MCGIVGCSFEDKERVDRGLGLIRHRGPDGKNILADSSATLGSVRLAIQDPSSKADQPMVSPEGDVWAAHNGEIYNHKEVRAELEKRGHQFETTCDTEVLLYAFLEWGPSCFSKFDGMFASVIWDAQNSTFHIARDQMGIKPLYFMHKKSSLIFGSEIKALLVFEEVGQEIDSLALSEFFRFKYIPGNQTLLKDIRRLPPGTILTFSDGKIKTEMFRSSVYPEQNYLCKSTGEDLLRKLQSATQDRMQADVPLGLYLSGGLDSSALASLMVSEEKTTHSFSIDMSEENSELPFARRIAEEFGCTHHEVSFDQEREEIISRIAWYQDDPIADPVMLANYQLAEAAGKHVKVVLSGEGADELFGGYAHYLHLETIQRLHHVPRSLRKIGGGIVARMPVRVLDMTIPYPASIGTIGRNRTVDLVGKKTPEESYLCLTRVGDEEDVGIPLPPTTREQQWVDIISRHEGNTFSERIMRFEQSEWLPNCILNRLDRMTMCAGMEGRVPYLSLPVISLSRQLPLTKKIRGNNQKIILREAFRNRLPEQIVRRRKHPFFVFGNTEMVRTIREQAESVAGDISWPAQIDRKRYLHSLRKMEGSLFGQRQGFGAAMFINWLHHFGGKTLKKPA